MYMRNSEKSEPSSRMRLANKGKFAPLPFILYSCLASLAIAAPQTQQSPAPAPAASFRFGFFGDVAQVPREISDYPLPGPIRLNGRRPSGFLLDTTRPASSL